MKILLVPSSVLQEVIYLSFKHSYVLSDICMHKALITYILMFRQYQDMYIQTSWHWNTQAKQKNCYTQSELATIYHWSVIYCFRLFKVSFLCHVTQQSISTDYYWLLKYLAFIFAVLAAVSCDAYKLATIALSVIAVIAIVIIILLVLYIVCRVRPNNGLCIALTDI